MIAMNTIFVNAKNWMGVILKRTFNVYSNSGHVVMVSDDGDSNVVL